LSTHDRAALASFEGVWDVRPAPRPGGPGARPPQAAGRPAAQNGPPPGPGRFARNAAPEGPDVPGLEGGDLNVYRQMTAAGRAAFEAMDPHDLPANNCRSGGVPTLAVIPFSSQDWSLDG